MIKEFALEPDILNNWKDFRYFIDKFDIDKGKLISQYPKNWKKLVFDSLDECLPKEKARIIEQLKNLKYPRLLPRSQYLWNDKEDWLNNAILEHQERPFNAIITNSDTFNDDFIIHSDNCIETTENPRWTSHTCLEVDRNAVDMIEPLQNLIALSRHIILIERNFRFDRKYINPIIEILNFIKSIKGIVLIEYHLSFMNDMTEEFFKSEMKRHIEKYLPPSCRFDFVRRPRKELHDRYILTNCGVVEFGVGLDEFKDGDDLPQKAILKLLGDTEQKSLWEEHSGKTPFFSLISEV